MASFDQHSRCARCRDKGHGDDACVKKLPCEFCELLNLEQVLQLSTLTYKLRKEKKQERESLVDPSSVTVLSSVDQDKSVGASSSLNTAGFNQCITKIQDSVQENLKTLQTELSKGKSSSKAQAALDELHYLVSFNHNISFAMGKSLQHLSDFIFVQMANLTLARRDAYLDNLKPGVKPDTFSALHNCLLNGYALFHDAIIGKAEDEITQFEITKCTSQPDSGHGGVHRWFQKAATTTRPFPTLPC